MINDLSQYNIETGKDGRIRAYNKINNTMTSYPRLIMENYLNRKLLKSEDVHHKDGNPMNNEISNLEVLDHKEHDRLHGGRNKKYENKIMICPICKKEFTWTPRQQSAHYSHHKTSAGPFCSKKCSGLYSVMFNKKITEENKLINNLIRTCPICGKTFTQSKTSQSNYNNKKNKFKEPVCSSACRHEYKRLVEKQKYAV